MNTPIPSLGLAFLAGLASFLSPCVFALVPAYIGYLGGRFVSPGDRQASDVWRSFSHGLAFVLGFSVVFISLGLLSSALGSFLYSFSRLLSEIGGIVVIIFGLHLTGLIHIRWLDYDLRPRAQLDERRSYFSSALMGVFFSAGWVPCVGPVLGSILTLALNNGSVSQGGLLLTAYSLGLAIPFLLAATQVAWVSNAVRRYAKLSHYVQLVTGVALIAFGLLLFSGRLSTLASFGFFFDTLNEGHIGLILLVGFLIAGAIGAASAYFLKRRGKPFAETWFLSSGVSFLGLLALYLLGVFRLLGIA